MIAGASYVARSWTRNTSTRRGAPVSARLTFGFTGEIGGRSIPFPAPWPYDYPAGDALPWSRYFEVPPEAAGQMGEIRATVTDPDGLVLAKSLFSFDVAPAEAAWLSFIDYAPWETATLLVFQGDIFLPVTNPDGTQQVIPLDQTTMMEMGGTYTVQGSGVVRPASEFFLAADRFKFIKQRAGYWPVATEIPIPAGTMVSAGRYEIDIFNETIRRVFP